MARADQKDNCESVLPYRATVFASGFVFLFFSVRDLSWSGGLSVIAVLSAIPAFGFIGLSLFGSDRIMRSLYRSRMVPEKSDQDD